MPPSEPALRFETPERVALSLPLAGIGARAFAWLADVLCIFLCWVAGLLLYTFSGDLLRDLLGLSVAGQLLAVAAVFLSGWGWDVAWEALGGGRTPGKRLLGLRVVRVDGGPVGPGEALVRNLLRAVELPLGYAPGVLAVALGPRRQRLGDLVAGTLVIRERRFDLSRYDQGPPDPRFDRLRGRAAGLLGGADFESLAGFLRRRPELDPDARARLAGRLAAAIAARAGLPPPTALDAEPFLEAVAAHHAEGA